MATQTTKSGGVSFAGLLFLLFLGLKLTNQIDWSWWWVTAPLWGPITLVFAFALIVIFIALLIAGVALLFGKKVNIEVLKTFNTIKSNK
jgi:hypothetical protein